MKKLLYYLLSVIFFFIFFFNALLIPIFFYLYSLQLWLDFLMEKNWDCRWDYWQWQIFSVRLIVTDLMLPYLTAKVCFQFGNKLNICPDYCQWMDIKKQSLPRQNLVTFLKKNSNAGTSIQNFGNFLEQPYCSIL